MITDLSLKHEIKGAPEKHRDAVEELEAVAHTGLRKQRAQEQRR